MYQQYRLRSGRTHTTCWLESDNRIRLQSSVCLHGEKRWWRVTWISKIRLRTPPQTDWKVGGIGNRH